MAKTMKAGVALADISPKEGVSLGGYPHHPRHNTGVHDPLYAACLYLDDGETRLVIVTMDLLMFSKRYVRTVREAAAAATDVPASNIMICCSHTHSAPRASAMFTMDAVERGQGPDEGFVAATNASLVDLIRSAVSDPFDAAVGVGRGYCGREDGVGGNRRDPMGIADPEVWTIGVKDAAGKWRAVLVKYALHPTFLHSDNLLVSADYPGYIRSRLARTVPEATFLFAQGTSGNQSPRYFRSGKTFAEAERVGGAIATEAQAVLDAMTVSRESKLLARSVETDIELRSLPDRAEAERRAEQARKEWETIAAGGAGERDVWNAELKFLGAEDTLSFVMLRDSGSIDIVSEDLPAEIQVIGIGDARMVCLPGELFVEFGLSIQFRAPFARCFVVELANGVLPGYAVTARACAEGGYEVGASLLTARSGEQLVDAAVELLYQTR